MSESSTTPPQRQSSRAQVSRIDRSYFQRLSRFQRARWWLIVAGVTLGVVWAAWGAFDTRLHHSPGDVAAVHAKWETDCNACHVPFSPIKDNTWLSTAATQQAMDRKCEACHRGPAHHPLQLTAEVGSCASCHADHRGRNADISRVADQTCTACHGNIAAHRLADATVPPSAVTTPITRFDNEHHPAFGSLASDPGRLKFSHGRHMRAGLTFGPQTTGTAAAGPWTYGMLAAADRSRYQSPGSAEHDLVQLSCASCHEFGTNLPQSAVRTVSTALAAARPGAYSLPVEFERHCAACHSLPFEGMDGRHGATADAGVVLPADDAAARPDAVLPHGLDAAGLARFLESTYLQKALAGDASLLDEPVRRPLPASRQAEASEPRVRSLVEAQVNRALTFARGTCEKCHDLRDASLPDAARLLTAAAPGVGSQPPWFDVAPTRVPAIWFAKARFDHGPHRGYDCRECHAAAYPDEVGSADGGSNGAVSLPVGSPLDNAVVMIAGRESCTTCHAPAGSDPSTGKPVGGARFDCVECHGYHGLGPHQALPPAAPVVEAARSQAGGILHGLPD
jgi:hypothetical protein